MYVGYSSTWNTSIYDLTTANIPNYFTHINLAFARPDTTYTKGSYKFDQSVAGFEFVEGATTNNGQNTFTAQQATDLRNEIAALKARGTQVFVSIGGWSYSQGSSWSNFNPARVVDLVQDLGASGVDVDWEFSSSTCNKLDAASFSCTTDGQISSIISGLYNEIHSRGANIKISIAGWSTGAYYVKGTPFEEGLVQWGSPFGGVMYNVVKKQGNQIDFINLMSYDAGAYYDPREGYLSYRAIYNGPINMGMEIAPEGAGGSTLTIPANGAVYDAGIETGQNNDATAWYNVETMVNYVKNRATSNTGFMLWQIWKQRVYGPAPAGAATENSAGQYVCRNLPLAGDCNQVLPNLPKD
jgi:chitinase